MGVKFNLFEKNLPLIIFNGSFKVVLICPYPTLSNTEPLEARCAAASRCQDN